MVEEHVIPFDLLRFSHEARDCWCVPVKWKRQVLHRPAWLLDRTLGFVTGLLLFDDESARLLWYTSREALLRSRAGSA